MFTDLFSRLATRYLDASGVGVGAASSRMFDDGKVLGAVLSGERSITLRRADAAMRWMRDNWPEGHVFPLDAAEPSDAPASAAPFSPEVAA